MSIGKAVSNQEAKRERKNELSQQISKNIDELNQIDAGVWIHVYEIRQFTGYKEEDYIHRESLKGINKKLVAAASDILKATIDIENCTL